MPSTETRGRDIPIEPCPLRTEFQRDRDRIIHSKAFRRLKHKTQVFISPEGDHYRTRLTHTLEVTQIARTIATGLCLNPDLTEAIALGHDVGHTPFGHAGEEVFSRLLGKPFRHNEQSRFHKDVLPLFDRRKRERQDIPRNRCKYSQRVSRDPLRKSTLPRQYRT